MRKFIQRALHKIAKLDKEHIKSLLITMSKENEQMEAVLDSLTDGILVGDNENNVILANKSLERLVQTSKEPDKNIWGKIKDTDISRTIQYSVEQSELITDKEFVLQDSGRILSISVMPLVLAGELRGNLVYIKDISEKRQNEIRLRRAENLASLTNLTAGVAHEIKNPLGSISIHIQLMERLLKRSTAGDDDLQKHLSIVSEEVSRLNQIVVDFLFAVRPINIHLKMSDINLFLHEIVSFLKPELAEKGIEITEKYKRELPCVLIDDKFMRQAIINIINNAASAIFQTGQIGIETQIHGDLLRINISDTGVGMSKSIIDKIFEPYFTTRDFGSGIGLTIVYKIVKEHRGEISVQSAEEEGSTFSIDLPIPKEQRNLLAPLRSATDEQSEEL